MISGDYPPAVTGVGDYVTRLAESLRALGADVSVFTGAADPARAASAQDWGRAVVPRVLREVDRLGPDPLVHIQYPALAYGRRPAINLLPAALKLLRRRCRVVVTMHEFRSMRRRWRLRTVPMLAAADAVILPDELDRPLVARWVRGARTVAIPIGPSIAPGRATPAEAAAWREEIGLPGPNPIVVFFGLVVEHKGLRELIAAVHLLRQRSLPVRLLIVGEPGPGEDFRVELDRLLLEGRTAGWARWLPGAAPDVVSRCLVASDLAAFPFYSGAMVNRSSLLVALAHGLSAVTTRTAATPASFGAATGMSLVPPRDALALAAAIGELLASPDLRLRLRDAGLRWARGFSWDTIARRTLELYGSLRADPAASPEATLRAARP
jgi:glycosyltransferase involved in cell wall biosynthesis